MCCDAYCDTQCDAQHAGRPDLAVAVGVKSRDEELQGLRAEAEAGVSDAVATP